MVKNNVEIDIKTMCIESGITQAKLAGILGITPAYVNRVIRQKETVVNRTLLRKKVMARISSPEDLTSYLRVTSPGMWIVLAAVVQQALEMGSRL